MQDPSNCLDKAMFVAAESYSNSTYEMTLFGSLGHLSATDVCDSTVHLMMDDHNADALAA